MTGKPTPPPPDVREKLTLDAIEALANIDSGEWTPADAYALLGDDLTAGLVLYANYLEAVMELRGSAVTDVRQAARNTASAWRRTKASA